MDESDSAPKRRRTSPRTSVPVRSPSEPSTNTEQTAPSRSPNTDSTVNLPGPDSRPRNLAHRPMQPPPPPTEPANPFRGRGLRRSGGTPPLDPELPPTRVEMGFDDPVVTSPATGIHISSSPSRRSLRRKLGSTGVSSGLRDVQAVDEWSKDGDSVKERNEPSEATITQPPAKPSPESPVPSPIERIKQPSKKDAARRNSRSKSKSRWAIPDSATTKSADPDPSRGIPATTKYSAKQAHLAALSAELVMLQEDLELATSETNRIREEILQNSTVGISPSDKEQVLQLLKTHVLPPEKPADISLAEQMVNIAMAPSAWLPFGGAPLPQLRRITEDVEEPVKSHAPVKMSMEEELPFLQLFTPLEFRSQSVLLKQQPGEPLLSQLMITAVPHKAPFAFACRVVVTIDTSKLVIQNLDFSARDVRARPELSPFFEELTVAPRNRALENNICVASWAMAEWYRVATSRAQLWCALTAELGGEGGLSGLAARERERAKKRSPSGEEPPSFGRAEVVERLGQTALELSFDEIGRKLRIRIDWKIGFDWTGEAVSDANLLMEIPGGWQKVDRRDVLPGVSKMFKELVRDGGDVLEASRKMVALLASGV